MVFELRDLGLCCDLSMHFVPVGVGVGSGYGIFQEICWNTDQYGFGIYHGRAGRCSCSLVSRFVVVGCLWEFVGGCYYDLQFLFDFHDHYLFLAYLDAMLWEFVLHF